MIYGEAGRHRGIGNGDTTKKKRVVGVLRVIDSSSRISCAVTAMTLTKPIPRLKLDGLMLKQGKD